MAAAGRAAARRPTGIGGRIYAKHGIGMFAIKYRLAKAGTYPKAVYDVKAAIQFVRAKAAELGADPDRIGLQGDSAGGHLASLVGSRPTSSSPRTRTRRMPRCRPA